MLPKGFNNRPLAAGSSKAITVDKDKYGLVHAMVSSLGMPQHNKLSSIYELLSSVVQSARTVVKGTDSQRRFSACFSELCRGALVGLADLEDSVFEIRNPGRAASDAADDEVMGISEVDLIKELSSYVASHTPALTAQYLERVGLSVLNKHGNAGGRKVGAPSLWGVSDVSENRKKRVRSTVEPSLEASQKRSKPSNQETSHYDKVVTGTSGTASGHHATHTAFDDLGLLKEDGIVMQAEMAVAASNANALSGSTLHGKTADGSLGVSHPLSIAPYKSSYVSSKQTFFVSSDGMKTFDLSSSQPNLRTIPELCHHLLPWTMLVPKNVLDRVTLEKERHTSMISFSTSGVATDDSHEDSQLRQGVISNFEVCFAATPGELFNQWECRDAMLSSIAFCSSCGNSGDQQEGERRRKPAPFSTTDLRPCADHTLHVEASDEIEKENDAVRRSGKDRHAKGEGFVEKPFFPSTLCTCSTVPQTVLKDLVFNVWYLFRARSIMYRASLHLQELIKCYLSYSYDFSICKLLPTSCTEGEGYTDNSSVAVYTAQQYLEHLPYLLRDSFTSECSEASEEEKQLLLFLSSTLLRTLNQHASRCCGETTSGSDAMGKRSTFIAWMVLTIYSHFAQEAERHSPICGRDENLKEVILTSSLKARLHVLSEWVEKRYTQRRHVPSFAEILTLSEQAPQQPEVDPAVIEGAPSQAPGMDTNEEEALWCEVETLFCGEKGELIDPLAADKNLFFHFFQDYIDPVLQRYPKPNTSADPSPFPPLQSKTPGAWCSACLAYVRCQFKVHPLSPESSILDVVVAATAYTLPGLQRARSYVGYWEEQGVDRVGCRQPDQHAAAGEAPPPRDETHTRGGSLSGLGFDVAYRSALYQALAVAQGAVQLIPSSLHAEEVEGSALSEGSSHLCGSWLAARAPASCRVYGYRLLHSPRVCVGLPGLGIAAVTVCSASPQGPVLYGTTTAPFPDAVITTGTMLVSPLSAQQALATPYSSLLHEGMDRQIADALAGGGAEGLVLPSTALHPVACLIFLRRLPVLTPLEAEGPFVEDPTIQSSRGGESIPSLKITDLVALVGNVREGVVLILVESHVGKQEQRLMEGWGTCARTVVVVGSVGEWGMAQLSLRWNIIPNSLFTGPSKLRCVRDGRAGVLLYPLDEMDVVVSCGESTKGSRKHTVPDVVERRTRWLVVVGECEYVDRKRLLRKAQADRTFSMSMPIDDDESDATSYTSSEDSITNSRGSSAEYTDDDVSADAPQLPFSGCVICSILVVGATDALQRRGLLLARVVRQHLVHRAVLPERLGSLLPTADGRVELSVLDHVKQLRATFCFTNKPVGEDGGDMQPEATVLFHARILEAMEDGLQSYLLSCMQHDLGLRFEEAWEQLSQARMLDSANIMDDENYSPRAACALNSTRALNTSGGADVSGEVYLTVRSAYLAIADGLDELCHTTLLCSHASTKASPHQEFTSEDFYFLPLIE